MSGKKTRLRHIQFKTVSGAWQAFWQSFSSFVQRLWQKICAKGAPFIRIFWKPKIWLFSFLGLIFVFYLTLTWGLPDITKLGVFTIDQTTTIFDRSGKRELYTIHDEKNRKVIPLQEMNRFVLLSVLAAEDDRFFEHGGYDLGGLSKAACYLVAEKAALDFLQNICPPRGGSTLSQQLAKNLLLTPEKTLLRKLRELILANRIEQIYRKSDILEMYLNTVPFGSDLYGIETASQAFFGKSTKDLTLAETAVLAGVIQRPSYFSPWGQNLFSHLNISPDIVEANTIRTMADLEKFSAYAWQYGLLGQTVDLSFNGKAYLPGRSDWVLNRMYELKYISHSEYAEAKIELAHLNFQKNTTRITAPHFVLYVREQLEEMFGPELVQKGGLKVYTTLDLDLQTKAEIAIAKWAPNLRKEYNTKNATLVTIDPHHGDILALVGSTNFWDTTIDGQVNVALRPRSVGSTFKPFVYAAAFRDGLLTPDSVLLDTSTEFPGGWRPKNFDGRFHGAVTVRQAIGNSFNIPAIKALTMVGVEPVYALAEKMGITFLHDAAFYGLTMAIGSADIRPLDLLTGYAIFANQGKKVTPFAILRVEDNTGKVIFSRMTPPTEQILPADVAAAITDILADPKSRGIGWNAHLQLKDRPNAIKTGTSNRRFGTKIFPADLWAVGYTPDLATVVWVGNTNGEVLAEKASGLLTSGDIWRDFMTAATAGMPVTEFPSLPEKFRKKSGKDVFVTTGDWLDLGIESVTTVPE